MSDAIAPYPWDTLDTLDSLHEAAGIALEAGISEETFLELARCAYQDLLQIRGETGGAE